MSDEREDPQSGGEPQPAAQRRRSPLIQRALLAVAIVLAAVLGLSAAWSWRERKVVRVRAARETAIFQLTAIATAVSLYQDEYEGRWPQALEDLVPEYLTRLKCSGPDGAPPGHNLVYAAPAAMAADGTPVVTCRPYRGVVVVLRRDLDWEFVEPTEQDKQPHGRDEW